MLPPTVLLPICRPAPLRSDNVALALAATIISLSAKNILETLISVVLPSTRRLPNTTISRDTVTLLNKALPLYACRYAATFVLP